MTHNSKNSNSFIGYIIILRLSIELLTTKVTRFLDTKAQRLLNQYFLLFITSIQPDKSEEISSYKKNLEQLAAGTILIRISICSDKDQTLIKSLLWNKDVY